MSQDEQFHLPYTWKCLDPLPLAGDQRSEQRQREQKARCEADFWEDVQPELQGMHKFGAELPTECIIFQSTDYSSTYWSMVANLPSWDAWRSDQDVYWFAEMFDQ